MTLPSSRPLFGLLFIALCSTVLGFNVDVKNCVRLRGPEGSMFGFSVAQHKERGRSWLLIGAPEAQTIQPGVEKGGAVFKCGTSSENDCQQIMFDKLGNNNSSMIQIDSKSRQWFGATVRSSGDDGWVMACAPRYVYFTSSGNRKEPVGTCYVTKDFDHSSEYSPCRTRNWGHNKQGTCQAGLGASVSKDGKRLFIGAVGSWYWQGQLYSVNSAARLPFLPPMQFIMDDIDEGQFYSQNLYSRPEVLSTNEGPPSEDDSYLGYSVAVGTFGFGSESGAAVGMPRGAGLLGKVVLYSTNLTNLYNITGDQLGAYFGYAICVSDVDGDGVDDIMVGAPMYSDFSKNDGSYETGKVYVYLHKEGYRFYERNTRMGFNSKSRFGLALSGLGDINRDGYGDFAVGAPYDGPDELGAVYIYHGTKTGVREKYSQVIKSEDVSGMRPISTFGFSLAGGTDLDNNQYPDLIIGAYESDTAYFMKSRPVAQMTTSIYFKSENKQIALERRDCTTKDGTKVPCLFLSTCLQYTGIGVDNQLSIEIQLVLDAKKPKSPRMFFLMEENRNVLNQSLVLDKNAQSCMTKNVYLKNNIRDKLTPIEAELRYRIIEGNQKFTSSLIPVIDLDNELFAVSRDSISIQKNCGGDNICIPNLRLIATPSASSFLLGSNEKLKVDVIVQNEGEDSFETTFDMTVPPGVNYVKIERIDDNENDIPVQCSAPSIMTNNTLHCDLGNPLPKDKYVQFKVVLEPYQTAETKAEYEFVMAVNSTNPENINTVSDNTEFLKVPLGVETDLIIEGSSKPVDVHYNITTEGDINITDEKQIGPQVVHIYGIRNKGPSDILEAEAYIDWPLYTLAGEPLLYLLEMPETNGQVRCEAIEEINPLKLNIDRKRTSYFESSGLISSGSGASVTIKGESTSSSGFNEVFKKTKTFAELTEEEKKRFLEMQKKDEEASKSQWGDGSSYEQRTRYQSSNSMSNVITEGGIAGGNNRASGTVIENNNRRPNFNVGSSESGGSVRNEYSSSKSGSTVVTQGGRTNENHAGAGTSVTNVNRGPTFVVGSSESGGVVHSEYGSSGSSHSESSLSGASNAGSRRGGSGGYSTTYESNVGTDDGTRHGSSSNGVYGAAHFGETAESSYSSVRGQSSGGQTAGTSHFSGGSDYRGGSSTHKESSVITESETRFGAESGVRGGSSVYGESSGSYGSTSNSGSGVRGGGSSSVYGESSGSYGSTSNSGSGYRGSASDHRESSGSYGSTSNSGSGFREGSAVYGESSASYGSSATSNSGSDSRGWSSGGGQASTGYDRDHQSNGKSWESSRTNLAGGSAGGQSGVVKTEEEKWMHENHHRANGGAWDANRAGSWQAGSQAGKNFSSFHEAENSRVVNTTWDDNGPPRTYEKNQWRTNDDGYVRNGSSTRVVEDGGLLNYHDAVNKMTASHGTNVVKSIPIDNSDLSLSLSSAVTDRQNQGFKQTKTDESETVQKWRTVDGKLYRVNNADDWDALLAKGGKDGEPTQVYEAQNYSPQPQEYRKPSDPRAQDHRKRPNDLQDQDRDGKFKLYTRFKRDTRTKKCGPTRCVTVKCKIGPLSKDQEVWLSFRSRAWVSTLKKVAFNRPLNLSSMISAKVTKLRYIDHRVDELAKVKSYEVLTQIIPRDLTVKPDIIPLWIVVLAAVAGTAILLLLAYLLYKCGFFKRNRPSNAPEKQPLTNRNGQAELYQAGDEAL